MQKLQESIHPVDHNWYKNLSKEQKQYMITNSKQQEIYRKPKPIDNLSFKEENFIQFVVTQTQKGIWSTTTTQIKLATYRQKSTKNEVKALVIIFHGLTSHTAEGSFVAKKLSEAGYQVVGFDQRGFGKSQGRRGYIQDININIGDAEQFVKIMKQMYKNLPFYILGLSMGGLLCLNLGIKYPLSFQGLILMAPAIRSYYGNSAIYLAKFLSFFHPYMQLPKGKSGKHGSKNPNVSQSRKGDVNRYTADPYANTLKCVLQGMKQSQNNFQNLSCNRVLLIQGAKDNSVHPDGVIELYEKCKCPDKQLLFYPNMWHNIWQQEEIYDIMPRIIVWLDKYHQK